MTTSLVTGTQYELRSGDQVAVVTEVGGTLRSYRVGERDVVVPFGVEEISPAVHGGVLVPWPNRIRDGVYDVDGEQLQLDLSEPERHNAIHGLARHSRWVLVEQSESVVELGLDLVPRLGYPFALRFRLRYELTASALSVGLTTTNLGETTAPLGVGFHPWLSPGGHRLEDCRLEMGARGWIEVDDRMLPVRSHDDIPSEKDFTSARAIGDTQMDDGFPSTGDGSTVRLTAPDGVTAQIRADEGFGYWQVFTGDGLPGGWLRSGLATEPMTCPADAFNSGDGLIRLAPGGTHSCRFSISLES